MKKILIGAVAVLTLSTGAFAIVDAMDKPDSATEKTKQTDTVKKEPKVYSSEAKADGFDSLTELEKEVSIIVRAVKTGKEKTEVFKSQVDGEIIHGYTETEVKIKEVFQNTKGNKKIREGKKILVGELEFKADGDIHTVNGYEGMKEDGEYLLFLEEEEGLFAPQGVTFGKIPLSTDDVEIYTEDEAVMESPTSEEELKPIFEDAREKYNE